MSSTGMSKFLWILGQFPRILIHNNITCCYLIIFSGSYLFIYLFVRFSFYGFRLLNGNQLTGSLPEELGYLPNLNRIQIDQNHISGPLPVSFANLKKTEHL